MENQSPPTTSRQSKKLLFIVVAILFIAAVVTAIILTAGNKQASAPEVKKELESTLQTSVGRTDNLEVNFDSETGLATVVQTDPTGSHGPAASSVRVAYVLLVKMGNEMFKNENVKSIQITQKVKTEESENPENNYLPPEARTKAKPTTIEVATIAITKDNFNSVNWNQYKGQPVNKIITEKAYIYTLNPELKPLLEDSDLYLDLQ